MTAPRPAGQDGEAGFVAQVPLRWIDQDAYGHVNHAHAVTLLEEARVAMVFDAAAAAGVPTFAAGLLVVGLHVDYRRQIAYREGTVRVVMQVDELRAASFRICYTLHDGPGADAPVAVRAWTRMATYDLAAGHPRRLTPDERTLLARWGAVSERASSPSDTARGGTRPTSDSEEGG